MPNNVQLLYAFTKEIVEPDFEPKKSKKKFVILTIEAGNYFEGKVYEYLTRFGSDDGKGQISEQGQHKNAYNLFEEERSADRYRIFYDGGSKYLFLEKEIKILGKAINKAALATAESFYNKVKKRAEGKKFTFELTKGGDELGDIVAKILKDEIEVEQIVLETKFQISSTTKVRWFGLVADTLFGNGVFQDFLSKNTQEYWSYKSPATQWQYKMRAGATAAALEATKKDRTIWKYLLEKGVAAQGLSKEVGYAQMTPNGTKAQLEFSLTDIANKEVYLDIANQKRGVMPLKEKGTEEELGTFGMDKYTDGPSKGPQDAYFHFAMYISQKLFH